MVDPIALPADDGSAQPDWEALCLQAEARGKGWRERCLQAEAHLDVVPQAHVGLLVSSGLLAEDSSPNTHDGSAFFYRDAIVVRHPHRKFV